MPNKRYKAEQIVTLLRQIEVGIANGKTTPQACKEVEITVQTYYRIRSNFPFLCFDIFEQDKRVLAFLDGPSAAEEIPLIISQLANALAQCPHSNWKIIHNFYNNQEIRAEIKCPFEFSEQTAATRFQFPPLLTLPSSELRPQLFEQYLFALFYGIFYLSYMAENHERLRHMDGALNKLREDEQRLRLLSNSLRQEAITEEIEVIMLSVDDSISKS